MLLRGRAEHPVGPGDYVVWLTTSLATVAGALESRLEDDDTAREAAYGYRHEHQQ